MEATLDQVYIYKGTFYGPGTCDIPTELAALLKLEQPETEQPTPEADEQPTPVQEPEVVDALVTEQPAPKRRRITSGE